MEQQEENYIGPEKTFREEDESRGNETPTGDDNGKGEKRISSRSKDEFAFHGTQSRTPTPPHRLDNRIVSSGNQLEVLDATPPKNSNSNQHIINSSIKTKEKKKRSPAETPWRNFDKSKSYSSKAQPTHKQSQPHAHSSPLRRMTANIHDDANANVGNHVHENDAERQPLQQKEVEIQQQLHLRQQQQTLQSKPNEMKMSEIDDKIRPSSLIDTTIEIVVQPPVASTSKRDRGGGKGEEGIGDNAEEGVEGGEELLEFSPLTCPTQPFGDFVDDDHDDEDEDGEVDKEIGNDDKRNTGKNERDHEVEENYRTERVEEREVSEGNWATTLEIEAENKKDEEMIHNVIEDGNSKKNDIIGNEDDAVTKVRNRNGSREEIPMNDDARKRIDFDVVNNKSIDEAGLGVSVDNIADNLEGGVGRFDNYERRNENSGDMAEKEALAAQRFKNDTNGRNRNAAAAMGANTDVRSTQGNERIGKTNPATLIGVNDLELKKRGRRFKKGATYKALAALEENDIEGEGDKGKEICDGNADEYHYDGHSNTDMGVNLQSSDRERKSGKPEQETAMFTQSASSPSLLPPPSNVQKSSSLSNAAYAGDSTLAAATTSTAATELNPNPRQEFIIKVHSELENLGKALACPLCLHTLKEATILPCMHAYCGPCITSAFCPPPTEIKGRSRSKTKNSPPRHASDSCPICKFKCGRRSMVRSEHLDELVRGYKLTLRAFGLTPIEHGAGVQMTQLDPEEVDYGDEDDEEANEQVKIPAMDVPQSTAALKSKSPAPNRGCHIQQHLPQRKRKADLMEYQQHLQVTKVVRDAFASAQLESHPGTNVPTRETTTRRTSGRHQTHLSKQSPQITREEIERRAKLQKYRILAQEQDAVVRADEEALNKVVKSVRKQKSDAANDFLDEEGGDPAVEFVESEKSGNNDYQPHGDKAQNQTSPAQQGGVDHTTSGSNLRKPTNSMSNKDTESIFEEFCTAPEGSIYSTAREESQTCAFTVNSALSPVIVHDGNTAKATRPKRKLSGEFADKIRNQSIATSEFSPVQIHDGDTVRKSRQGRGSNFMLMDSQPEHPTPHRSGKKPPRSKALKISHSEEAKTMQLPDKNFPANEVVLKEVEATDDDNPDHDYPAIDENAKSDGVRTEVSILEVSSPNFENINDNDSANEVFTESQGRPIDKEQIKNGSIVMVQSRLWPGINKPGGVARVVKVHQAPGNSLKYDVAYVLGGREKKVDESFLSLHNVTASTHASGEIEVNGKGHCMETSSSRESSRRARQRSALSTRRKSHTTAQAVIPNLSTEALKEIPADVLEWAGIVSVQSKKKPRTRPKSPEKSFKEAKSPSTTPRKNQASRHNKRALQESTNVVAAKKTKKLTSAPNTSCQSQAALPQTDKENMPPGEMNEPQPKLINKVASTLSEKEAMDLASKRYSSLLCFPLATNSSTAATIYAITSSLSDRDTDALESLCKVLKANKVNIKIMKEFQPNKTMLCITSTSTGSPSKTNQTSSHINVVVSKTRTSKVMRSALAGIPIVTPAWMNECLKHSRIVSPAEKLFVNTLPMKRAAVVSDNDKSHKDELQLECFGVAKYAAKIQRAQSEGIIAKGLLHGVGVMMCGSWKMIPTPMKKDLKVLLQEAGATSITSASVMSRALANIASDGSEFERVVFLCDDSECNKSCGISEGLLKEVEAAIDSGTIGEGVVLAVNFNWLFDCISCAAILTSKIYQPIAPRAKELWRLTSIEE